MWKIGDVKKFNNPQRGLWELKEIIENSDMELEWKWGGKYCPHCDEEIIDIKKYKLIKLFIWENDNGDNITTAETEKVTKDGLPLHLRLPDKKFYADKDISKQIKEKSKYLKDKEEK